MYRQLRALGLYAIVFVTPSLVFAADTLVFAIDIIRHGDRTPVTLLPTVDYQWNEGLGQLTALGMQQEYMLGASLRKRYVDDTKLLPESYIPGTMYARSTGYDRTLMSAQSFLMGLYPPGTGPQTADSKPALPHAFQPIPVFSAPTKVDDVMVQQMTYQEYIALMEQYVYPTPEWQQKENSLRSKFPLWSKITGIEVNSLDDLQYLGDTLYIHKLHHAPMPAGLSSADIDTIIESSSWAFMASERPQQIGKAFSYKLVTHIAKYLENASQKKSPLKYVLFSGHDNTITATLSFLGAPQNEVPAYASNVNFSLYENGSEYTVKVTYNGKPVPIPACGGEVCELTQFLNLVANG